MFQLQDYFYVRNLAENSSISIHFIGTNFADIALFGVFRELRKKLFHKKFEFHRSFKLGKESNLFVSDINGEYLDKYQISWNVFEIL